MGNLVEWISSSDSKEEEDQRGATGMITMTTNKTTTTCITMNTTKTRTLLIILPCLLFVLTLLSIWLLPSSYYYDFIHRISSSSTKAMRGNSSTGTGTSSSSNSIGLGKQQQDQHDDNNNNNNNNDRHDPVPKGLFELGIYDEKTDFVNEHGISPTGWESTRNNHGDDNNNNNDDGTTWGPCHFFKSSSSIQWNDRRRHIDSYNNSNNNNTTDYYRNADVDDFDYHRRPTTGRSNKNNNINNDGWCRPGFLIIGAGKCGTSSLYHYLVGHPRVVPAIEKQIHYFRYVTGGGGRPLEWYYGHFPTPQSFLEHGALLTGEASPGYLPYPEVAITVRNIWKNDNNNNHKSRSKRKLSSSSSSNTIVTVTDPQPPKIVMVGREPIDRMYSSYRYNYVVPTIKHLRTKGHPRIKSSGSSSKSKSRSSSSSATLFELHHPDDDYYKPYLYTLEEFVRAELKQLKSCIYEWGAEKTYEKFKHTSAYKNEIIKRRRPHLINNHQPFIDIDGICYGNSINRTVYREQWSELQMKQSNTKVLLNTNLHLTQALIGRSLYTFPLEWWYHQFPIDGDITFICTEELTMTTTTNTDNNNNNNSTSTNSETTTSSSVMDNLALRLGLPKYDGFKNVLKEGAYNVGGHRGYDTATSWEELELGTTTTTFNNKTTTNTNNNGEGEGGGGGGEVGEKQKQKIPLPDDLYQELKEFISPLNERLFALTGKRCNW